MTSLSFTTFLVVHIICKSRRHECRAVRICDVSGSCNTALAACGPKVESGGKQKPCAQGQPVVNLSGMEMTCGPDHNLCPFGFHCHHQLCCPTSDMPQENRSPQTLPSNLTLNLCIDRCQGDADCQGDGQICCINGCSSQCHDSGHRVTPVMSRQSTNSLVPFLVSGKSTSIKFLSTTPSPSYRYEIQTPNSSQERPRESIDVAAIPIPKESRSRKRPMKAPSLNRGTDVTLPADDEMKLLDADFYNNLDNPARNYPQKAGQCPSQPKLTICGQSTCTMDENCPGPTRCCVTHCGRICVTPEEMTGRLNKLRPYVYVFRDIGFGKRRQFRQSQDATNPEVFGSSFRNYGLDCALRGPDSLPQNNIPEKSFGFSPQEGYAGLYRHEDGPLYAYGFRPSTSDSMGNSLLNQYEINSLATTFNTKNSPGPNESESYDEDNSILGHNFPFQIRSQPSAENGGHSRVTLSTVGSPSFAMPVSAGRAKSFGSFPGYGPHGFKGSKSGLHYGHLDPGSFGGIDKKDSKKLGTSIDGITPKQ